MFRINRLSRVSGAVICLFLLATGVAAQRHVKRGSSTSNGRALLWQRVDVGRQDTFLGPGGAAMKPDLSRIEFIKEEKGGYSKKYRIRDGSGSEWVAKVSNEAQSETAAVRLLSAIGYVTEINYLVPTLTIPGVGTFSNVRLEARPDGVKRGKDWKWGHTPFERTPQMKGLMMMMAFINNWDMKSANNVILHDGGIDKYVISDLGVSFGKTGSNPLPIFWRIGRSRNDPKGYARKRFISGTSDYKVRVVYNGKNRSRMHDFTKTEARWLADLLLQLTDNQIENMFRAANYSDSNVRILTRAVKDRIVQLDQAASNRGLNGPR